MKDKTCKTCRFYYNTGVAELCRRFPAAKDTCEEWWCGEWEKSMLVVGGDAPIDRLGLPSLLWGKLRDMGIHTIADLLREDPGNIHLRAGSTVSISSIHKILSALWHKGMIHAEFEE